MRKRAKGRKSELAQECEKLFSLLVRKIGSCERCGATSTLQWAHVLPRGAYPNLKFDILNSLCLCYRCHINFAHKSPLEFTEWFKRKFPERYIYLMTARNVLVHRTLLDYEELKLNIINENVRKLTIPNIG